MKVLDMGGGNGFAKVSMYKCHWILYFEWWEKLIFLQMVYFTAKEDLLYLKII
jgi:hypothetical protein